VHLGRFGAAVVAVIMLVGANTAGALALPAQGASAGAGRIACVGPPAFPADRLPVVSPGQTVPVSGWSNLAAKPGQTAAVEVWVEDTKQPGYINYNLGVFPVLLVEGTPNEWIWTVQVSMPTDIPAAELGNTFQFHCALAVRPVGIFVDSTFLVGTRAGGPVAPPAGPTTLEAQSGPEGPLWPPINGQSAALYIWHDPFGAHAWHMRATTLGRPSSMRFLGDIQLGPAPGGAFSQLLPVRLETGKDWYTFNGNPDVRHPSTVQFSFGVHGHIDGLDFVLSPTTKSITFALGGTLPASQIFLGQAETNPPATTFTINF
jgi:hypothetical protein